MHTLAVSTQIEKFVKNQGSTVTPPSEQLWFALLQGTFPPSFSKIWATVLEKKSKIAKTRKNSSKNRKKSQRHLVNKLRSRGTQKCPCAISKQSAKRFRRRRFFKILPKNEQKNSLKIQKSLERDHLNKLGRDAAKAHPYQVWSGSGQWFWRRSRKCELAWDCPLICAVPID